jgi:hypothetical protein
VARGAGVPVGVGVQREHRIVECTMCYHFNLCVRQRCWPGVLHQARRVRQLGVDDANGIPDVDLVSSVRDAGHSHHERQHRHGRDGVADQSDDGDDDVRSDRRLEHRRGDEHGEPVLPIEYRTADVQRRHQQVERGERVQHVHGMCALPRSVQSFHLAMCHLCRRVQIYVNVFIHIYLMYAYLSTYIHISIYLSISISIYLSIYIYPSIPSSYMHTYIYLSMYLYLYL